MINIKDLEVAREYNDLIYLLRDYSLGTKKNNDLYINGEITDGEEVLKIVIWDKNIVDFLRDQNLRGQICSIAGSVSIYKGAKQLTIEGISPYSGYEYTLKDFLNTDLNINDLYLDFDNKLKSNLSQNGYMVYQLIFNNKVTDMFKQEFAGTKVHDAKVGGLLNHTNKMLNIGLTVLSNDSRIEKYIPDGRDLLLLGIVFHDVGKIYEYHYGQRQKNSYVTHRAIGIEMIHSVKSDIINLFNEDFYYQLVAVIQGHHGEYGEEEKTVLTRIVHLIDMLDTHTTMLFDNVDTNKIEYEENIKVSKLVLR